MEEWMKDERVYSFYLINNLIRPPCHQTIDETGTITEGKHLFNGTYRDAYKMARKRAKKYCKANRGKRFRFYFMTDSLKRMTMFDCTGSFYRDNVRGFVRGWTRLLIHKLKQGAQKITFMRFQWGN